MEPDDDPTRQTLASGVDLDVLTRPFPREALKQRRGGGSSVFTYVAGHTVIHRLNDATGNHWDMRVISVETRPVGADTLVMAHVSLTIPGLGTRDHIGVQKVSDRGGEDLVKGAVTDALKKAATLFGVALELYGEDYEDEAAPQPAATNPAQRSRKPTPAGEAAAEPSPQQGPPAALPEGVAAKQRQWLNRLQGLCTRVGITPSMLNRYALAKHNVPMGQLTQDQMSAIAAEMMDDAGQVDTQRSLALWDTIAGLTRVNGMDHMRGAARPGATEHYPPQGNAAQAAQQVAQRQPEHTPEPLTQAQNRKLRAVSGQLAGEYGATADELLHGQIWAHCSLQSVTQLSKDQASRIIDAMERGEILDWQDMPRLDVQQRQEMFGNGSV